MNYLYNGVASCLLRVHSMGRAYKMDTGEYYKFDKDTKTWLKQ